MDAAELFPFPSLRIIVAYDTDPDDRTAASRPFPKPSTYRCPLQNLVSTDARGTWTGLLGRLPYLVESMDRPSFRNRFPECAEALPLIGLAGRGDIEVLLESHNLRDAAGLDDLAWLMETTLSTMAPLPDPPGLAAAA
jgi:hypothetical protein